MKKDAIIENESIQNGLEQFLEKELQNETGAFKKSAPSLEPIRFDEPIDDGLSMIYGEDAISRPVKKTMSTAAPTVNKPRQTTSYEDAGSNRDTISPEATGRRKQSAPPRKATAKNTEQPRRKKTAEDTEQSRRKRSAEKDKKTNAVRPMKKTNKKEKKPSLNKKGGKKKKNEKKKSGKLKKVLVILLVVIIAALTLWYFFVGSAYQKMTYVKSDTLSKGALKKSGVINILLIGNDSRENGDDGRSDAMILLSISEKTKTIHMTSLLRDMYVDIPGHDGNRLNAAYSYGGAELLCETIKQNLGIEVDRYVLVNFQAFANLVDAVGGIDLELTNEEVKWVNAYLNEYNLLEGKEMTTDYLDTSLSGEIHLNGPQALAYCRNRYIGTDFGRTERQRKVLSQVMKKLPLAGVTNSSDVIDGLFPNLTTNLTQTECYRLSFYASKFLTYETQQITIPADGTYSNASIRGMDVLQVDFSANRRIWEQAVYGE